jgi:transglutaminase-like putative cysteine protease
MFDDNKVKVIVFPGVGIGSTLTLHYQRIQRKPLFPGHFFVLEYFSDGEFRESVQLTIRAPLSMNLHVDAVHLPGGLVVSDQPGAQLWKWSLANCHARQPEMSSVSDVDYSPRIAVSTFVDFAAVGKAYLERAAPMARITPAIPALADKLTRDVEDRRQQAEILYNWISTHVRYVAVHLGIGSVVPHSADAVLTAVYGDCKDHVTLFEALLAAKGIKSAPVLVNSNSIYWLPEVALPVGVFDHAITYLPEFAMFVDSTAGLARFGVLPATELGKPALVTDDGSGCARVTTLPVANPDNAGVQVTTHLAINQEGDVTGTSQIENGGVFDLVARQLFAGLPPGFETQLAARVLTMTGQDGSGVYAYREVHDLTRPFRYETQFTLPDYALLPGPGAIPVPPGLGSFSNIGAAFEDAGPERRQFAMPIAGRHVTETTTIVWPDSITLPKLPSAATIVSSLGTYTSAYHMSGQTLTVVRSLKMAPSGALLHPDQYPEFRTMARAVKRDLRSQLVYY